MKQLQVELGDRSYPIYIDEGVLSNSILFLPYCLGEKVLILTNQVIEPLYFNKLAKSLAGKSVQVYIVADGEGEKNLENYSKILDFLISNEFKRNDTLIALGGGVIGDLGGFVAASYQRGMGFIQVPTTLLAQVDSSVGGKTAVNHPSGKNMIGAFYQPKSVVIDILTLHSLPEREFLSGLAEVAKYAILGCTQLLSILLEHTDKILARDKVTLSEIVRLSCYQKAKIVAEDEKEAGNRALLNLGHTFGHAIEKLADYGTYLHGEAVAIGIQMALNLSEEKSLINASISQKYRNLLSGLNLPSHFKQDIKAIEFLEVMKLDKKNLSKKYRLVLPTDDGCVIVEENDASALTRAIEKQVA